ncbi:MAG: hypothetical protein AAF571_12990 [Verrucomicrobiota bacterium]
MKSKTNQQSLKEAAGLQMGKVFLYTLICSVGFASLIGIMALLSSNFGEVQIKVLLTALSISGASLCGLAAGVSLEKSRVKVLGWSGMILSLIGCAGVVCGIWTELANSSFWKGTTAIWLWGAASAHGSLLALARLKETFIWSKWGGITSSLLLATVLSHGILTETFSGDVWTVIGILSILIAGFSICTPIFHLLSRSEMAPATKLEIDREIEQLKARLEALEHQKAQLA